MRTRIGVATCVAFIFAGCATQAPSAFPTFDKDRTITLAPGQSVILSPGQTAKVPAGTKVIQAGPGGNAVNIRGQNNKLTFIDSVVIVSVSPDATGPADNLVIAK